MTVIMDFAMRYEAVYLPTIQDKTIRTPVTLPAVLYEYLVLCEEFKFRMSEKKVPRRIYEPKMDFAYGPIP
jgi:hypothetical protein